MATLLCGCVEHRYYVSPFNGNFSTYHPVPLKNDSVKSGYYVAAAITIGSANDQSVDDFVAFNSTVSGGHNFGSLQAFYSLNLSIGNYKVASSENIANAGNKFFGGTGFEGGLNAVIPIAGGEWRIIGVETSLRNEFGNYLQFRKTLPKDQADLVITDKFFGTVGGYSEIITYGNRYAVGFRLGAGTVLGNPYHDIYFFDPYETERLKYRYAYYTIHLMKGRYIGYLQLNAAAKAGSAVFGLNYRL